MWWLSMGKDKIKVSCHNRNYFERFGKLPCGLDIVTKWKLLFRILKTGSLVYLYRKWRKHRKDNNIFRTRIEFYFFIKGLPKT
jgi:hypothetical protein